MHDVPMPDTNDLVTALTPVIAAFENCGVEYYIGGSIASSHHGVARSTMDADLNAVLNQTMGGLLISSLQDDFYVSRVAVEDAIRRKSCFNLLHYETNFKIDIFVNRNRPFDQSAIERAIMARISEDHEQLARFATPEDIVLLKLEWYQLGDCTSERQWSDMTDVLELNSRGIDLEYLQYWANELRLSELWKKLKHHVGL